MTAAASEGGGSTFRILFAHTKLSLGGSINESGKVQKKNRLLQNVTWRRKVKNKKIKRKQTKQKKIEIGPHFVYFLLTQNCHMEKRQ